VAHARKTLDKRAGTVKEVDSRYTAILSLRSVPMRAFMSNAPSAWALPITSVSENSLLKAMGISAVERNHIEGLQSSQGGVAILTEEQQTARAIVHLAKYPPPEVADLQQRTATRLLRPFPLGLRFSGKNMSPLPCWLAGGQFVCLNFTGNDSAVMLHFALFSGSGGFVLKPSEMRMESPDGGSFRDAPPESPRNHRRRSAVYRVTSADVSRQADNDVHWPPPRVMLACVSVRVISLHNLPKYGEQRPSFDGRRGAAHKYHPELSGASIPPNSAAASTPALRVALAPIGGFCAVSKELPLRVTAEAELFLAPGDNGMNAHFDETVHCVAAEPDTTFLKIGVIDGPRDREVAYVSAVLGRLRGGHRVFQLRGRHGSRIELCFLFVHITLSEEPNLWPSANQQKKLLQRHVEQGMELDAVRSTLSTSFNMLPDNELQALVQAWYAGTGVTAFGKSRDELIGLILEHLSRLDANEPSKEDASVENASHRYCMP